MSQQNLSIGPSTGGAGDSVVTVKADLTLNSTNEALNYVLTNLFSPCYPQPKDLAAGTNALAVPASPQTPGGLIIVPPLEATYRAVIRGISTDFGIALAQNAPTFIAFGNPGAKLYDAQAVTLTNATDVVNLSSHGLVAGVRIRFGGTLPAELSLSTVYYVAGTIAAGTFQVALSPGGSAVLFTTDGSGVTITTLDPPGSFSIHWGGKGYLSLAATADSVTDKITVANTFVAGDRVRFTGTTMPGGLVTETFYYVVNPTGADFQVSTSLGGSAIDITSNGSGVAITSADRFTFIWV